MTNYLPFDEVYMFKMKNFGIIWGEDRTKIVLIKEGQCSALGGYKDKYKRIAYSFHQRGYTVACSSYLFFEAYGLDHDFELLEKYVIPKDTEYEVLYFGHSNGGLYGAIYSNLYPEVKKWCLSNVPLNYHKQIQAALSQADRSKFIFVYSEYDTYCRVARHVLGEDIEIHVIPGQDHNYTLEGGFEEFCEFPVKYLLG